MDAENIICLVKQGLTCLDHQQTLSIEYTLDVGCGQDNLLRVLLKEKLVKSTVGVDRSTHMIDHAQMNSIQYADETYTRSSHAENLQQFSQIISTIARVCGGIFVGLISNPKCDLTSVPLRKLLKHGVINRQYDCDEEVNRNEEYLIEVIAVI